MIEGLQDAANDHERLRAVLTDWWLENSHQEIEAVVPKAVEYGPHSMITVGRAMAQLGGRNVDDEEAIELACMLYIYGKVGRWLDAATSGRRPSGDTIYDIKIYAKMAERNRDVGGWPFGPDGSE